MGKDIGYLIKQVDDCLLKKANRNLELIGLTFSQARILMLLREREKAGRMTSHVDIEESIGAAQPTVAGLLRRLKAKGFIRTEAGTMDRRVKNVFLANIDASLWETMRDFGAKTENRLLAGFSKEEVDATRGLLERMLQNIL
jgi:DNA-binding MarR family transcriptional regulator